MHLQLASALVLAASFFGSVEVSTITDYRAAAVTETIVPCTPIECPDCLDMMGGGGPGHSFQQGGSPTKPGSGGTHVAWAPDTCGDHGHSSCGGGETFDALSWNQVATEFVKD